MPPSSEYSRSTSNPEKPPIDSLGAVEVKSMVTVPDWTPLAGAFTIQLGAPKALVCSLAVSSKVLTKFSPRPVPVTVAVLRMMSKSGVVEPSTVK